MNSYSFYTPCNKFTFEFDPNQTISDIKTVLVDNNVVEKRDFYLLFKQKILKDDQVIKDLNISSDQFFVVMQYQINNDAEEIEDIQMADPYMHPLDSDFHEEEDEAPAEPPNFAELVQMLTEMGFPEEHCQRALRIARYNVERAGSLLVAGDLPRIDPQLRNPNPPPPNPEGNPPNEPERPTAIGSLRTVFDSLNDEERNTILRLENQYHLDRVTVVQVYIACDKNEESTRECLVSMV